MKSGFSWNSGAIRMPPTPASSIVSTHAVAEVRPRLIPRSDARLSRSTVARISSPTRVRRTMNHNTPAAIAAAANTDSWSLSR